jgi:hypothetical protein
MKAVIYTEELLPITIVDLPVWAVDMLTKYAIIEIPVPPSLEFTPPSNDPIRRAYIERVVVRGERFRKLIDGWRGVDDIKYYESLILYTKDEESAMRLKAAFLPGQEVYMRDLMKNYR